MSTFLQLCQQTAADSGTFPGATAVPTAVIGQDGRLLRVVNWVAEAYRRIQTKNANWRWMNKEFSGDTIATVQTYAASALGITTRFSNWIEPTEEDNDFPMTIFLKSAGDADEGPLVFVPWQTFYRRYLVGAASRPDDKPNFITIDDQDKIRLSPTPDAIYTIRGLYHQAPQILAVDADIPEMPAQFHDLIKWRALDLLATFDEGFEQKAHFIVERDSLDAQLNTHQIPKFRLGGALA